MKTPTPYVHAERAAAYLRRAVTSARAGLRPLARWMDPVASQFRRSLQLRVITITVVASGLLIAGFGYLVADRSTSSLLEGAAQDAGNRVAQGRQYAIGQLAALPNGRDPSTEYKLKDLLSSLASRPEQGGGVVVVMRFDHAPGATNVSQLNWPEQVNVTSAITPELKDAVAVQGQIAYQVVSARLSDDDATDTYLVYGTPVPTKWEGNQIELYYLVPLTKEAGVAEDVRNTVLAVGAALVLLLLLVVALVTRMVVNPVRLAAQTAQRLSAGLLDQRMIVRGEDDLALLADAFNQMAGNLQKQIVRLEEMSRLQRRFTSDVSHELRTPLTTVRMAADMLHSQRDQFDPAVARSAELLQTELDRFEELLTDLLEISRFDAGFAMLDAEPMDLVSLVHRVAERLEPVAERVSAELTVVAPEAPVIAEVDARRVERILRNLLGNAVDHSEGRPVAVTLASDGQTVAITVRDHGVGLKRGEEKLVFNRFWRADPSRARQTGGTGLGLSISIEDAHLHGGKLEAWGEPGRGAQFRLTLPVRAGARLAASPLPLVPVDAIFPRQTAEIELEVTAS